MNLRILLLALALAAGAMAGCATNDGGTGGGGTTPTDGTTTTPQPDDDGPRAVTVGTEAAFPPFEDIDENGDFVGFDIDIIREVASRAGWEIEIENLGFDTLIPSVQNGQIDAAISAMSITEARSEVVDFSIAYYEANQSIMQLASDEETFTSLDDLRGQNLRFGVQSGTTAVDIVEAEFTSQGDGEIKRYDSYPLAIQALKTGDVDVVMMDAPAQREAASTDSELRVAFEFSTGDQYGIAVAKGSELLDEINDALEAMFDDGTLAELREKWGI